MSLWPLSQNHFLIITQTINTFDAVFNDEDDSDEFEVAPGDARSGDDDDDWSAGFDNRL